MMDQKTHHERPPPLPLPPQWVLDVNSPPPSKTKNPGIPDPPGYPSSTNAGKRGDPKQPVARKTTPEEMDTLKVKKAWEVAIAPAKQLPMNAFGMWMTGNTLQIFSIFMVFTLFKTPLQSLANINASFARFESDGNKKQLVLVKVVFVLTNLLALGLGLYKINKMGLLPTTRSDWLAWESEREPLERAFPAFDS